MQKHSPTLTPAALAILSLTLDNFSPLQGVLLPTTFSLLFSFAQFIDVVGCTCTDRKKTRECHFPHFPRLDKNLKR